MPNSLNTTFLGNAVGSRQVVRRKSVTCDWRESYINASLMKLHPSVDSSKSKSSQTHQYKIFHLNHEKIQKHFRLKPSVSNFEVIKNVMKKEEVLLNGKIRKIQMVPDIKNWV